MNALLPRFLKVAYRREPISSFIVIMGAVDAVLGGLNSSWSLMTFGVGTVGLAILIRWWLSPTQEPEPVEETAKYYLPPQQTDGPLPNLTVTSKRRPPRI